MTNNLMVRIIMGNNHSVGLYPLVNVYITMERSTMLLMEKSTISMAIFPSFLYVYQRVMETSDPKRPLGKWSPWRHPP